MPRWVLYLTGFTLSLLTIGCQNMQTSHRPADPAGDLQRAQSQPVQTPIPSAVRDEPIVITELSANDTAALSDGLIDQKPPTQPTPKKLKAQVVITKPDPSHTAPVSTPPLEQLPPTSKPQRIDKQPSDLAFARRVSRAHGQWYWRSNRCVQANIKIVFDGNLVLEGKLLTNRLASQVRLTLADGTLLVYDGKKVWMSPANAPIANPRFNARTWALLLTMPFKLNQRGAHLQNMGTLPLSHTPLPAAKLTWARVMDMNKTVTNGSIVYVDPKTHWLRAMTYNRTDETGASISRAVTYDNYANVAGVILPRTWKFWNGSQEQGLTGPSIGYATLTHLQMVYPAPHSFTKPQDAVLCEATPVR